MKESYFNIDIEGGRYSKKDLRLMYLSLTNKCNLKCLYCYDEYARVNNKQVKIPLEVYEKLVRDCKTMGLQRVCLTGGELFLNKNWYKIACMFKEADISIAVSSNGTMITDEIAKQLKDVDADVQISLDGDEDIMTFVTGRKFTYKKVMDAIKLLKKNDVYVALAGVIAKHNPDSVKFLNEFSIKHGVLIAVAPYNHIFNDGSGKIKYLKIEDIHDMIYEVNEMRNSNPNIIMRVPPLLSPENLDPLVNPGCGWAYFVCGVLHDGTVTVCPLASSRPELSAGNIMEDSFENIWLNSPLFNKLREYSYQNVKGICSQCPVIDICMGFCRLDSYCRYDDFLGPNRLCQQYYEAILDGRIQTKHFPSKMLELS